MRVGQRGIRMQDPVLRRLSGFNAADLGPHATALFRELISTASAGLSLTTIILAASIVDVVQHEQAGPAGYLDGVAFSYSGSRANLGWLRGRRNQFLHHEKPIDGLMYLINTVKYRIY